MKCFVHTAQDAVATCKYCHKGVCLECAKDVGPGIACSEPCAEQLKAIHAVLALQLQASRMNRKAWMMWPAFFLLMGVMFFIAPLLSGRGLQPFTTIAGLVFAAMGVSTLIVNRKAFVRDSGR
jgi:hypothetical protein